MISDQPWQARAGGPLAGVDEAGRGPLAGPVVVAAVILDRHCVPPGINDSKRVTRRQRDSLFLALRASAAIGIGAASVAEIDAHNILAATILAMQRAVARLPLTPALVLIDGNRAPALACPAETVVKGDSRSLSIAAASIVAKVVRDRAMTRLAAVYPGFGWEHNAGYGTKEHLESLSRLGPTAHHRRSFAPVRELLAGGGAEPI